MAINVTITEQFVKEDFYQNSENAAYTGDSRTAGGSGTGGDFGDYYTRDQVNTLLADKPDIVGSPVDNQLAIWTGATGIEGSANLTYDGDLNLVSGALTFTGAAVMPVASVGLDASNFMWVVGGTAGLKLTDDGANGITILDGGNAGFGTATPNFIIDAVRDQAGDTLINVENKTATGRAGFYAENDGGTAYIYSVGTAYAGVTDWQDGMIIGHDSTLGRGIVLYSPAGGWSFQQVAGTDLATLTNGGDFGIGITPSYKLDVNGTGHFVGALQGDSTLAITGISTFTDNLVQPSFTTGFQGSNWQIEANGNAEFNDMLIRGGLSVYELIINQLRYQDGGLIIGAGGGKISAVIDPAGGSETLTLEDPEGNGIIPFTVGAIVLCQDFDLDRTSVIKKLVRQVDAINSDGSIDFIETAGWTSDADDTGAFAEGDTLVSIGHVSDTNLDSVLYMSAVDSGNPFLRIMDGINSYSKWSLSDKTTVKVQLGNLASLSSYDIVPASPGFGLYSDNVFLTGKIVATSGEIGGWIVDADSIKDVAGTVGMSSAVTGGDDVRFFAGHTTPSSAPFKVTEAGVLTASSGTIGGWVLGTSSIEDSAGLVGMSSAVTGGDDVRFWAGHTTPTSAPFYVTEAGVLQAASGTIGGWTIDSDSLYTGVKDVSGFATDGITLSDDGTIHSPAFYSQTGSNDNYLTVDVLQVETGATFLGLDFNWNGLTQEVTSVVFNAQISPQANNVLVWTGGTQTLTLSTAGGDGKVFWILNNGGGIVTVNIAGGTQTVGNNRFRGFMRHSGSWYVHT